MTAPADRARSPTLRPIALSLGDPAGIGPEIILKAWSVLKDQACPFFVVGDHDSLVAVARGLGRVQRIGAPEAAVSLFPQVLPVLDLPLTLPVVAGKPSSAYAADVIRWIETGAGLALSGAARALVTAPIAKAPLYEAGFAFPGHTEFLAALTTGASASAGPVMMLTAGELRTVLVTVHEPLSRVPALLTRERVASVVRVTAAALASDFGVERPRLALAALNPHAGERGGLGREEVEVLSPAAEALRAEGIDITDPLPADTLFHTDARRRYDAVVCLYHDQALIPVKTIDFWGGVNITLGLPIVRTSPDHGVAYDIAGRGLARADSLIAAVLAAATIAARREHATAVGR